MISLCLNTHMKDLYAGSQTRFYLKELFFSCDEDILAKPLARVQREFPTVQLGSYPDVSSNTSYRVRITFESVDRELVEKVSVPDVWEGANVCGSSYSLNHGTPTPNTFATIPLATLALSCAVLIPSFHCV